MDILFWWTAFHWSNENIAGMIFNDSIPVDILDIGTGTDADPAAI